MHGQGRVPKHPPPTLHLTPPYHLAISQERALQRGFPHAGATGVGWREVLAGGTVVVGVGAAEVVGAGTVVVVFIL